MGKLVEQIKSEGYEFDDFKITFSISVVASLNKLRLVLLAEEQLQTKLEGVDTRKMSIDFKEVFKWVVSPVLVNALGKPANLGGKFLINVNFSAKADENKDLSHFELKILKDLKEEVEKFNQKPEFKKRDHKWGKKKEQKPKEEAPEKPLDQKDLLSVDEILKKATKMPRILFYDLPVFKNPTLLSLDLT